MKNKFLTVFLLVILSVSLAAAGDVIVKNGEIILDENATADYFFGDGSQLTGISATDTNCTDDSTCPLITYDSDTIACSRLIGNSSDLCTLTDTNTNTKNLCADNKVLLGQATTTCVNLNDTIDARDTNDSVRVDNLVSELSELESNFTAENTSIWTNLSNMAFIDKDTNETTRINALVVNDCSGTNKVYAVNDAGDLMCSADVDTNESTRVDNLVSELSELESNFTTENVSIWTNLSGMAFTDTDTHATSDDFSDFLNKTGGTMTGDLVTAGASMEITDINNQIIINESDAGTDNKTWVVKGDSGGIFTILTSNDAFSAWDSAFNIYRNGNSVVKTKIFENLEVEKRVIANSFSGDIDCHNLTGNTSDLCTLTDTNESTRIDSLNTELNELESNFTAENTSIWDFMLSSYFSITEINNHISKVNVTMENTNAELDEFESNFTYENVSIYNNISSINTNVNKLVNLLGTGASGTYINEIGPDGTPVYDDLDASDISQGSFVGDVYAFHSVGLTLNATELVLLQTPAVANTDYVCVDESGIVSSSDEGCTVFKDLVPSLEIVPVNSFKILNVYSTHYRSDHPVSDVRGNVHNYFFKIAFYLGEDVVEGTIKVPGNMHNSLIGDYLKTKILKEQGLYISIKKDVSSSVIGESFSMDGDLSSFNFNEVK